MQTVGTSWISLLMNAPLVGITKRASKVLHAVDNPLPAGRRCTVDSRCGRRVKIVPVKGRKEDGVQVIVPWMWRPRVADLPDGFVLCPECKQDSERPRKNPFVVCDVEL
jgi:hypothetical protein